jgi:hypothetical protein
VTALGVNSNVPVSDHNPYYATADQPVKVGDFVWLDGNHNGVQDTGEPGVAGVVVTLTDLAGHAVNDASGALVGPVQTDANGKYEFSNLPAGQYVTHVDYSTAPTGYLATMPGKGTRGTDSSTDSATSLVLRSGESDHSLDFGLWQPRPAVSIVKRDVNGNDADSAASAVTLADGSIELVYTVANTGDEALTNITVSDKLVAGGTVTDLSCTFGDKSAGTSWSGPFPAGASFTCTAKLSGVEAGASHEDLGLVAAVGLQSKTPVKASNRYFAVRPMVLAPNGVDTGSAAGHQFSPLLAAVGCTLLGLAGLLAMLMTAAALRRRSKGAIEIGHPGGAGQETSPA